MNRKQQLIELIDSPICRAILLLLAITICIFVNILVWQPSAGMQGISRGEELLSPLVEQPAIITTSGSSRRVVIFPDPAGLPNTQTFVAGLPAGANPHGAAYYGADNGLIADAGNSRIFVIQVSTGALLATIDTAGVGYNGSGTIAVSPDQTTALVMGSPVATSTTTLYVVRSSFTSSSAISTVTMPGSLGSFQTEAIVFSNAGRAFVYTTAGISVLDAPYTAVAFTIPTANANSGSIAITPDGNTILVTDLQTNIVGIIPAPYSSVSTRTNLPIPGGSFLDGIAIAPDGSSAIVVSNGVHHAAAIAAPFTTNSMVSTIPLPFSFGGEAFEDVGISADSQLAVLAGGSIAEPPVFIRAPFGAMSQTANVLINDPGMNNTRGRGAVRFRPPMTVSISVGGRVTTPTGQGLRNTVVSIIDPNGVRRNATTSSFGIYSCPGVTVGTAYTLTVASKRYRFAPKVMSFSQSVSNVDFVGLE